MAYLSAYRNMPRRKCVINYIYPGTCGPNLHDFFPSPVPVRHPPAKLHGVSELPLHLPPRAARRMGIGERAEGRQKKHVQ